MFPYEPIHDFNEREKKLEELKETWKDYEEHVNEESSHVNLGDLKLMEFVDTVVLKLSMTAQKIDKALIGEDIYNYILETKGQFYIDEFNKDIDDFRNKRVTDVHLIQPNGTLVHLIHGAGKCNRSAINRLFDTKHTNKYKRRYRRR